MIEIQELTTRIDGRPIINGASFKAERGEVVAIVGPNGAGKTTLLESIIGLHTVESGKVLFGEACPEKPKKELVSFRSRADVFAYMPDEALLPEEASVETILIAANPKNEKRREEVARHFGIERFLNRGARQLSRGEAKRVWLASTILLERPVLVLDEPFGAFDPLQLDVLVPAVKEAAVKGGLALVTIHQLSIAERIADRVVILSGGRVLAQGTLDELRAKSTKKESLPSLDEVFRALLLLADDDDHHDDDDDDDVAAA